MATKGGKNLRKLRSKLTLALMTVVVLVALITAFTALRAHQWFFSQFIVNYRDARTELMAGLLSGWYEQTGSWDGVRIGMLRRGILRSPDRMLVLDERDAVVLDTHPERDLPSGESWRQWGAPVMVAGETVGQVVLMGRVETGLMSLEQIFTDSVRNATLLGGLFGIILAALLGLWWSTPMSRRLAILETASRRLGQRELSVRVPERNGDELDEVGKAFNFMAESLEKSERARRNLVADIAHELRTPLSILRGNLEALQEAVLPATPELISSLVDETVYLSQLVSDLQELSLAEAQALSVRLELHTPGQLIEAAISAIVLEARAKGVEIEIMAADDLPSVWADRKRVQQILLNLLSNAVRHAPSGGKIWVAACAEPDDVLFSVRDDGPGLSADEMELVFDRFYGRGRWQGSSGLGLAIARGLVEAHGGRMWAQQPQQRSGAEFCFTLKRQAKDGG